MPPTFDHKLALFHRNTIQQMRSVGLSAYLLREDGSVIRFKPDGQREYIVSGSIFAARLTSEAHALAQT
jgi:hypothetical protein